MGRGGYESGADGEQEMLEKEMLNKPGMTNHCFSSLPWSSLSNQAKGNIGLTCYVGVNL